MSENLSKINGIPRYIQIRESLLVKIRGNEYRTGERLPPEDDLAKEYNVSRMTVRQALSDLVHEGILQRRQGIGTFVSSQHITRQYNRLTSFYEEAKDLGLNPTSKILSFTEGKASKVVASHLKINAGDPIYVLERLRLMNSEIIALNVVWISCALFPNFNQKDAEGSLYQYYVNNQKPIVWAKQHIEARSVSNELANLLNVSQGSPILYSERVTYTHNDVPIERVEAFARGDGYSIEMTLYRDNHKF